MKCRTDQCERDAIVFLSGRPLCYQHYVDNLNELNQLGLTPRGLTEDRHNMNGSRPIERRVREPVEAPEPSPADRTEE